MIGALKVFVLPLAVWLTMLSTALLGILWRAELPVLLYAVLAPLPTLWYPTHEFVFGKDSMDLLIGSAMLGVMINKGGFQRTP